MGRRPGAVVGCPVCVGSSACNQNPTPWISKNNGALCFLLVGDQRQAPGPASRWVRRHLGQIWSSVAPPLRCSAGDAGASIGVRPLARGAPETDGVDWESRDDPGPPEYVRRGACAVGGACRQPSGARVAPRAALRGAPLRRHHLEPLPHKQPCDEHVGRSGRPVCGRGPRRGDPAGDPAPDNWGLGAGQRRAARHQWRLLPAGPRARVRRRGRPGGPLAARGAGQQPRLRRRLVLCPLRLDRLWARLGGVHAHPARQAPGRRAAPRLAPGRGRAERAPWHPRPGQRLPRAGDRRPPGDLRGPPGRLLPRPLGHA